MKRFLSILVMLVVLSLSLVTAVPILAATTGNIADNDLGAQLVGMSQQICVQSVTISNSGAGSLLIDYVAITNTGTAGDADVTQVALYFDDNPNSGSWETSDTLIGSAADFTAAVNIGVNDDTPIISVGAGASADFFVVVTTAAAPTDGNTFKTIVDASDLTSGSTDSWDGTGGIVTATSATTIDGTAPTVAITSTESDPTNNSPIPMTATFSEGVTGFVLGDITVGNGSAGNFSGSGAVYTFDVTPAGQGTVTVDIAASVAQDAAANDNTAASQFSIEYDSAAPTLAITSTASDPTNTSPIPITVTFSESVTGFTIGDITVGNGTASNFGGSGAVYTFDVTPASQGMVTVDIAAGVAQDAASNGNTAAPQFTITYDSAGPSVAITSTESSPTDISPIPITVTFSESVNGFTIGDITAGNGTASNFAGGPAVYTFDVTPTDQGIVTVDIAASVAQDAAANDNTAAPQFTIRYSTTVGGTVYPINKASVMIPWFGLAIALILAIGGSTLALRKRRT